MMKTETRSAPAAHFFDLINLGVDLVMRMMGTNIRGVATAPLTVLMNLDVDLMRRTARKPGGAPVTPRHWRKEERRRITPDLLEEDRRRSYSVLFFCV
jgi:hypothetical protein